MQTISTSPRHPGHTTHRNLASTPPHTFLENKTTKRPANCTGTAHLTNETSGCPPNRAGLTTPRRPTQGQGPRTPRTRIPDRYRAKCLLWHHRKRHVMLCQGGKGLFGCKEISPTGTVPILAVQKGPTFMMRHEAKAKWEAKSKWKRQVQVSAPVYSGTQTASQGGTSSRPPRR